MKLFIKFMVGAGCIEQVKIELEQLKIPFGQIEIGGIEFPGGLTSIQREKLRTTLLLHGLLLQDDNKRILSDKIKGAIHEMIQYSDGLPATINSTFLSKRLNHDYTYLANIFSEVNGISIQQYIILSKIDRVKELMSAGNLNLSEISYQLHYSSVAHLSAQFKKITGYSPSAFKLMLKEEK